MRRDDLEQQLSALGWQPSGPSGANHVKWTHPRKRHALFVRQDEVINVYTARRILDEAER